MIPIPLTEIETLGRVQARPWASVVTGVKIDSRLVEEGDLFVAVGERGADFVAHALARGADAVLEPHDAHAALAAIAGAVRRRSTAKIVAITGSTGKTTTKDILAALCAPRARTVASEANFNNELGVPLTLCRIETDTEICIAEMGMRGLRQIDWLARFTQPDVALITNVGPVHLEFLESVENVARAKAEVIEHLRPGGVAVVPDDRLLDPYLLRTDIEIRRFGRSTRDGQFNVAGRTITLTTNFTAGHQFDNLLAALIVCDALGLHIEDGTLDVAFSPLREEEQLVASGALLLNDSYNANPISMRAALEHAAGRVTEGRLIAVLGTMAELGADSAAFHREIGEQAANLGVTEIWGVGEAARGYDTGRVPFRWFANAADVDTTALLALASGDVVLVKGSRSVGLETVAAKVRGE
ncbi:MAG: UDP-N-acetylmuramoyl-tripeptide--D-alanyl-D-alanine ligase [Actinobacteria bacterium]|uniref:UDP-MurNAc-pentapeptide synthetase n=1 Tax=freshwater metagenome TaxID=449393 RepID=A0A6J6PAF2_9ZZZZ|nr:UDP-N-acetylmuramoyl-tripeptide--D-alanyl-D-alanine ligase [Actinomycetota bacterium]